MDLGDLPIPDPSTLHYPRILMLHGGGTNAHIFRMQCRGLELRLKSYFRLVYVEAPYPSSAGPDVLTVYADCGPFKRWVLTTSPNAVEQQPRETWAGVEQALADAMDGDDRHGATGQWLAILGFSQGAKMVASVLLRQQEKPEALGRVRRPGSDFGFRLGVLMAGRGPLLQYDPDTADWLAPHDSFDYHSNRAANRLLRIPTIHVHGLQDPGLPFHQSLLREWCEPSSTKLVQWDGDHRLPLKLADTAIVVDAILEAVREEK